MNASMHKKPNHDFNINNARVRCASIDKNLSQVIVAENAATTNLHGNMHL